MSASGGNETALLGSFARKQVKYGSTCKYVSRSSKTIKHVVQPGDTLQGIALRYGVTTEELKRANRLWTMRALRTLTCQSDESFTDFLGRIDNSIAKSRSQLRQLSHTRFDDCGVEEPTAGVAARDSAPAPVVMTRQVKHSLQRHERDHEEIFQL
ncbi:hypothetical protein MRX96_030624 [Rhipicephalus microplus]